MKNKLPMIFVLGVMAGCSMTPEYGKPNVEFSNQWQDVKVSGTVSADMQNFLIGYGDAALAGLSEKAMLNNNDIAASFARVKQARSGVEISRAALKPELNASGGYSRDVNNQASGKTTAVSSANSLLSVGYELDLWGKNRAAVMSKEEKLAAAEYAHRSVLLTVSTEVASLYTEYRLIEKKIGIAADMSEHYKELEDLTKKLSDEGKSDKTDYASARIGTENAQKTMDALKTQGKTVRYALAAVVGEAPQDFTVPEIKNSQFKVPAVSPFQPSDLLTRRPDIAEAEAELKAANADIGAARAAFYPTVNLSASVGAALQAGIFGPAAQSAQIGSDVLAPIFTGGSLTSQLESAKAKYTELAANYRQTVLTAFSDTQTALAELDNARRNLEYILSIERERLAMLELDKQRYNAGRTSRIDFLKSQNTYLQSRLDKADADLTYRNAVLSLYKAMGGEGN